MQKGTALVGGLLTDEAIASSKSLTDKTPFGGQKGAQQFYSPQPLADLVRKVMGGNINVLDLTAGDGSLLKSLDPPNSFGVEMDADQIRNAEGGYNAIHGDVQHVYTLLKLGTPAWEGVALNPPFGLQWEDPSVKDGASTNSAVMTFIYGTRLLSETGQLVFVCGTERLKRQILDLPEAAGVYAVIDCGTDLFPETTLPCSVAFAIHPGNRSGESVGYESRAIGIDMLDMAFTWIDELRETALGRWNSVSTYSYGNGLPDAFKAIQKEHDRRTEKRLKKNREYDLLLVGGSMLQWLPSAYAILALKQAGEYYSFNGLHGQSVNYFATDERLWNKLAALTQQGLVTIEPRLIDLVQSMLDEARKEACPMYDIKPQQRLGFLADVDYIGCIKDDPTRGFVRGEQYRLNTKSQTIIETEKRVVEKKGSPGEYEERTFEKQKKVLRVTVGDFTFDDSGSDASENIQWLIDHFLLPDPGQVGTKHPEEIAKLTALVNEVLDDFEANSRAWEAENPHATPFTRRQFQIDDIARLAFKGGGLLSWKQGLGKTLGALMFSEVMVRLGAQDQRLFVVPGDLIEQWERECQRFLGYEATVLKPKPTFYWETDDNGVLKKRQSSGMHGQAKELDKHLRSGGTGTYITYYEALTLSGTRGRNKALPPITVFEKTETRQVKGTGRFSYYYWADEEAHDATINEDGTDRERVTVKSAYDDGIPMNADGSKRRVRYGYVPPKWEEYTVKVTSKEICPECRADWRNGWNGMFCEAEKPDGSKCGYAHYASKLKPAASFLSQSFRKGIIVLDEATMIQGLDSKRSIAMRGLYAKHKLAMTGTPIKNFVAQAFWILWWCLGNGSKRFGYQYDNGHTRFESNFSVIEWSKSGGKRQNRKALPEVTNLSLLWKLLSSSVIRRRKEETGEWLPPKWFHEVKVPLGMNQAELIDKMLKDFYKLFAEKYPNSKVVAADMHKIMAPLLGLNAKLDYALTLPEADPDFEWWDVPATNWTPGAFRTVELAMALAKQGRKVLVGSNLVATSKWIADRLAEKGVHAIHILDEDGTTADKDTRAKRVYSFQTDDVQVFCAGVKAIRLGHNLDAATAVILHGLDWDYETLDQFIDRIHRLTSKSDIDVYVIVPQLEGQETLTSRKWGILKMKGAAADLALDGRLIEAKEDEVDQAQVIRELVAAGITVTDDAVDEYTVAEAFEALPMLEAYEVPPHLIPTRPRYWDFDGPAWLDAFLAWEASSGMTQSIPTSSSAEIHEVADGILDQLPVFETWDELLEAELAAIEGTLAVAEAAAQTISYGPLPWWMKSGPVPTVYTMPVAVPEPVVAEPEPEPTPDVVPDELALAQNAAEMPEPSVMEQMLAAMKDMQAQLAELKADNEELKQQLSTDTQLSLFAEVS